MHRLIALLMICLAACLHASCKREPNHEGANGKVVVVRKSPAIPAPTVPVSGPAAKMIASARHRVLLDEKYDPSYFRIGYPGGDVPDDRGVCTDVVIRAYRSIGIDLQVAVHEDMLADFDAYPKKWGLRHTDVNIDHRRVPNLQTFFDRHKASVGITDVNEDYRPGDLVTWMLPGDVPHIGIVSNRRVLYSTRPLILHNIGHGTAEDDILFTYRITGHYRYFPANAKP